MAARSMWKGTLRIAKQTVKVKLYAAVEDAAVHFHLLDAEQEVRVEQRMVNPETNEPAPKEEVGKAYEIEPGTFVRLSEAELDALQPEASRDVTVDSFLPSDAIGPGWYERPYYLGPDGSTEEYFALVAALKEST